MDKVGPEYIGWFTYLSTSDFYVDSLGDDFHIY